MLCREALDVLRVTTRAIARPQSQGATLGWVGKCVESLEVENQRFGQARLARRRAASGTAPSAWSSSSKK